MFRSFYPPKALNGSNIKIMSYSRAKNKKYMGQKMGILYDKTHQKEIEIDRDYFVQLSDGDFDELRTKLSGTPLPSTPGEIQAKRQSLFK